MEAHALNHSAGSALQGRSPLLRLQSDEKLIALIRRGHHGAFDALFQRYQSRLLAFCRHMLASTEDAEDVLQEVFTAAFNAILADDRPINARPWLYRIARNRCLNHLRRPVATGLDSMDVFERDAGATTADTVHQREEFRQIVSDVQDLPETQRTALLLREIDALSYDQIAEAMDTTVPSVKSLLVRARVSLAEASEARLLTCEEVRFELGQVAEGLTRTTAPVRRHLKHCERCRLFRSELRKANRALAAVYPIGLFVVVKKLFITKLGTGAAGGGIAAGSAGAGTGAAGAAGSAMTTAAGTVAGAAGTAAGATGTAAAVGGTTAAVGGTAAIGGAAATGAAAAGGMAAGSALSAGLGAVASKTVAGLAAVTIVTAGAVEVNKVTQRERIPVAAAPAAVPEAPAAAPATETTPLPVVEKPAPSAAEQPAKPEPIPVSAPAPNLPVEPQPAPAPPAEEPPATGVDEGGSTTTLPPQAELQPGEDTEEQPPPPSDEDTASDDQQTEPTTPPGETESSPEEPQPAPVAGEDAPRPGE
jgi:RNA polymerase sigma factor (sigma-70 family)